MDYWPLGLLVVIAFVLYWFSLSSRTQWRDRGAGEELDLKPPGEPGNRGGTDMTGTNW
jgi:hypothetical protein